MKTYENKDKSYFKGFLKVWRFRKSWKLESLGNLESLKICKVGEMNPLSALYRRRNWLGVISPKIWGETPAVRSPSDQRMWGTKRRLKHLMRRCRLWSARTIAGREVTLSRVEVKEVCGINHPMSKPHSPPQIREEKPEFWRAIVGVQELK